jgi:predicted enzyme related to lactoylglutathione lyase
MIERIGQIAITVQDVETALSFYRDRVGLKYLYHDANVALFDLNGTRLMLGRNESDARPPHGTVIYFMVADLGAEFDRIVAGGVKVLQEPHILTRFQGREIRMAFFQDPDENIFALMSEG